MNNLISINYSIVYIVFGLILFVCSLVEYKNRRNKKSIQLVVSIIYIFIFSFRGYVGYDWFNYLNFFRQVPIIGETFYFHSLFELPYEFGFCFYISLIKTISQEFLFFNCVNSAINIFLLNIFFNRYAKNYSFSFLVFYVMGGLVFELDFLRNMKSILLFLISIKYIERREFFKYMFLNVIGCCFHISSLVYIPMYFFLNKKLSIKIFWILFIIANIIFLFQIPILQNLLDPILQKIGGRAAFIANLYFEISEDTAYGLSVGYIERLSTAIIVSIMYNKLFFQNKSNLIFVNSILVYLLVFFFFGEIRQVTLRAPYLFFFAYSIIIPNIYILLKTKRTKKQFILIVLIYSILKIHGLTSGLIYKYDNFLIGIESEFVRTNNRENFFVNFNQ